MSAHEECECFRVSLTATVELGPRLWASVDDLHRCQRIARATAGALSRVTPKDICVHRIILIADGHVVSCSLMSISFSERCVWLPQRRRASEPAEELCLAVNNAMYTMGWCRLNYARDVTPLVLALSERHRQRVSCPHALDPQCIRR